MNVKSVIFTFTPAFSHGFITRIYASSIGYRLAKGAFWSLAGAVISRGLGLLSSIFVARMLGKIGFGELGIIQSTLGMFGTFAGFGLGLTATKYVAEFREKAPEKAGRIIALSSITAMVTGVLISLILFFLSPWLASETLSAPHLASLLRIGLLLVLLGSINGAQTGALAGFEAFKAIACVNLLSGLATFPLIVAGTYFAGVAGAVWGFVGSMAVNSLLNRFALMKEQCKYKIPVHFTDCMKELPVLYRYSLPALLGGVVVGPVNWLCNAILVNQPNGYAEMGIYNSANQWFNAAMFLPSVLSQVILPMLSSRFAFNDTKSSTKMILLSVKMNAVIIAPIVIVGCAISSQIMSAYGSAFTSGWPAMVFSLLTAGILAIISPVGAVVQASGKMWIGFAMNFGWGAVFVTSAWFLANWGATGLAGARLIAYVMHSLWVLCFIIIIFKKGVPNER